MMDKEVIVWDKRRGAHLDYLRVDFYEFSEPEGSFGYPENLDDELQVYGWANIPYDPDQSAQTRRVFVLEPEDLGGHEFDLDDCDPTSYPDRAIDAHNIEAGSEESIEEPKPQFGSSISYTLENIPDMVHPTEDKVRFKRAEYHDFCIELDGGVNDGVRLSLDREFSTYTLIQMAREIDEFEVPETITGWLVSNKI